MGVAVGSIGMSLDDFCRCDYDEFESICKSWRELTERQEHDAWERTRVLAAICIQPHVKGRMTPEKLLPLPWDKKQIRKNNVPELTRAEDKKRFDDLLRRLE